MKMYTMSLLALLFASYSQAEVISCHSDKLNERHQYKQAIDLRIDGKIANATLTTTNTLESNPSKRDVVETYNYEVKDNLDSALNDPTVELKINFIKNFILPAYKDFKVTKIQYLTTNVATANPADALLGILFTGMVSEKKTRVFAMGLAMLDCNVQ